MSISSRISYSQSGISYVQSADLIDTAVPTERAPRAHLSRRRQVSGLALGVLGLPLLTLALDHTGETLSLEGQVLLYLLAVVVIALVGGVVAGVVSAVAAALLINYFFVDPIHTLEVAQTDQAVSLVVFVAVASLVSGAVELAVRRARAAEHATAQAETLSALAGADLDEHETLRRILQQARDTFKMETVALKSRDRATGEWTSVEQAGWALSSSPAPLRFDVPIGVDLRLVGRGPALFAEDQRVPRAFAAAAETAFAGRRLSERANVAQTWPPSTASAPRC